MLNPRTDEVLFAMGTEYVRIARRELKVTRTIRSKITGKDYKKKVEFTGRLGNSFKVKVDDDNMIVVDPLGYADEVNDGTPRDASWAKLIHWIRNKPYRFRIGPTHNTQGEVTNLNEVGRFRSPTDKEVDNFAQFLRWKIGTIGSDRTGFLDGIFQKVNSDFDQELSDAITKDMAQNLTDFIENLPNTTATNP